jgi:threonine-phosphate decarboxylase
MKKGAIDLTTENLIAQVETVRADLCMNPLGTPESATKAIRDNLAQLSLYPDKDMKKLKESISAYCGADTENIVIGGSSYEFIKLLCEFITPKKALLVTPGCDHYEKFLSLCGCEINYYNTIEEENFVLDIADFIAQLSEDIDVVFLSNPNRTTSSVIDTESMEFIVKICQGNDITLVVDEEYMDFCEDVEANSAISLTPAYDNLVVLRNTTKFFAVPGLRLSYMITGNAILKKTLEITGLPFPVGKMSEIAGIAMFGDTDYIAQSHQLIHTERNLVYSALSTKKSIKLFKPDANFILVKILNKEVTAQTISEHCLSKGLYIRSCADMKGLDNSYIRFSFMKPHQDDLLVNTILEIL